MNSLSKYQRHISGRFNTELENAFNGLLAMGGIVEQQLGDAVEALISGDSERAEKLIANEDTVNKHDLKVNKLCTNIIAIQHPIASDLRLILSVVKTTVELEGIGNEVIKIADLVLNTKKKDPKKFHEGYSELINMTSRVQAMLQKALDAFARLDIPTAVEVMKYDNTVDQEYEVVTRIVTTYVLENPKNISKGLEINLAARALERIGDHISNICYHLIFMVEGKDVRHTRRQVIAEMYGDNVGKKES